MPQRRLSVNELLNIVRLHEEGMGQRAIAAIYNVSHSVINRAIQRQLNRGNVRHGHGGGRRRLLGPAQSRFLIRTSRRNPTKNATQLQVALRAVAGPLSTQTIRRTLHAAGMRARRRVCCPQLMPVHRRNRLAWANEHGNWDIEEWRRCLFSDESRFTLYRPDGRIMVWRQENEQFREAMREERVAFGGGGVTIWGGISLDGRTELMVTRQSINAERYRDLCLIPHIIPYANNIGNAFILVDDNARPHRARLINNFLEDNDIRRLNWPARSPDMNPIEHVWARLGRQLSLQDEPPQTIEHLVDALHVQWRAIPQVFIRNLIESMPRRLAAVVEARGGPTHY